MTDKYKVLLILPSFSSEKHYGKLSNVAPSLLPVSLVYLAAWLEKHNYRVEIFDGQVQEMTERTLKEKLSQFKPQVVGITCMTPMAYEAHKTAEVVRNFDENLLIVMGGIHPSILPDETLEDENVDIVVRGEGEFTFHEVISAYENDEGFDKIKGVSYRDGNSGRIIHTEERELLEELDILPFPALHLIPMDDYHQIPDAVFALPLRAMITSRGCPFKCIFCSARLMSGYKYRYRSPENVLGEMDILINKYNAKQIAMLDDNFVVNRERTVNICEGMIRRDFHKRTVWTCAARADQVEEELMRIMKKAGCKLISFGVETGTQRIMDLIQKDETLEQIQKAVELGKKAGLLIRGTLMLGLPTETVEESRKTIEFAKNIGLDFAKFSIATPYPGTVLYNLAKKQGLIDADDWSRFSSMAGFSDYDPVYVPEGREPGELKKLQKTATREFYLRPRQIFHLLKNMKGWKDFKMYFYAARSLLDK